MRVELIRGIQGSGKTRYANSLLKANPRTVICSADDYHLTPTGVYDFKSENLPKAHLTCLRKFLDHLWTLDPLLRPELLVVDNTNTTTQELAPYVQAIELFNDTHPSHLVKWEVVSIYCPFEVAANRCVHQVPLTSIWEAWKRFTAAEIRYPHRIVINQ